MELQVIKTESQYREYLERAEQLIELDPEPESFDGKVLELLALLIEVYEKKRYEFPEIDPVDAIVFRMEEEGLQQKDLIPYIGSKSKVSEVLSRKRPLTLRMIRALHQGLGIPATLLVADHQTTASVSEEDYSLYPCKEMEKRGWLADVTSGVQLIEKTRLYFEQIAGQGVGPAYSRRTLHLGGNMLAGDNYALNAWLARIKVKSRAQDIGEFNTSREPLSFLKELVVFSCETDGPRRAVEHLRASGVRVVFEPHLPRTLLDGAAVLDFDGSPVIGLTLRHDREDNFWFTLLHEVVHVMLHLNNTHQAFVDVTDSVVDDDQKEREANRLAKEACIPRSIWHRSRAYREQNVDSVFELAEQLRVSPAIVAGRIRWESNNYKKLSKIVGHGTIRQMFQDEL